MPGGRRRRLAHGAPDARSPARRRKKATPEDEPAADEKPLAGESGGELTGAGALALEAVPVLDPANTLLAATGVGPAEVVLNARGGGSPHLLAAPSVAVSAIHADTGVALVPT